MRETKYDKMGIEADGRRKVTDMARYSVGDLLSRALMGRDYVRWSQFVLYTQNRTACKPSDLLRLQSFIMDDAPFLAACGLIDPKAVEEVLKECGGLGHLKNTYNVTNDPRSQVSDRQRLVRNHRYVRGLLRNGEVSGGSAKKLEEVLMTKVPVSGDRPLITKLIMESGYIGNGTFSKSTLKEKVVALGFDGDLKREEWDFTYMLTLELSQKISDAAIEEDAGKLVRPPPASVGSIPVPVELSSEPVRAAADVRLESGSAPQLSEPPPSPVEIHVPPSVVAAPPPPSQPVPAPAASPTEPESEALVVKKPVVECAVLRAVAHRTFQLMLRVLQEEHAWPFESLLPSALARPVAAKLWHGAIAKPDMYLDLMKKNGLLCRLGVIGKGKAEAMGWGVLDVELREIGISSVVTGTDDVRAIIKDAYPKGMATLIKGIGLQNPELLVKVTVPEPDPEPEPVFDLSSPLAVEIPKAPEPPPPPPPAPAVTDVKKPVVVLPFTRLSAYLGLLLMAKVLTEEHAWPFGNVLPNCLIWPVNARVWPNAHTNPALKVNALKQDGLVTPAGRLYAGFIWRLEDVEAVGRGEECAEISVDDVREIIATEFPQGVGEMIGHLADQNPKLSRQAPSQPHPPPLAPPVVAPEPPKVVVAPPPPPPKKTLQELFNDLSPAERSEFVEEHLQKDIQSLAITKLKDDLQSQLDASWVMLDEGEKELAKAQANVERLESTCNSATQRIRVLEAMLKKLK